MEQITVSIHEIRDTATTLRMHNKSIERILEEIRLLVNQSDQYWQSKSSSAFRIKFNGLKNTFDSYYQIINEFASYLDKTCEQYELNENTLTQNINAF